MKKIIIITAIILLTSMILVGCYKEIYISDKPEIYDYDHDKVKKDWYYTNGNKKASGTFINRRTQDMWTEWYINGQKKMQGMTVDGKKILTWKFWNSEGSIVRIENFDMKGNIAHI